jgi:hypothetical protein
MRNYVSRFMVFCAFVVATATLVFAFGVISAPVQAQDDAAVACDSTLATLLLVAEHEYDYLSHMMMEMPESVPNLDLGQYGPLIESIVAMMTAMAEDMSEEDMMAMEEMNTMVAGMMEMSDTNLINSYLSASGMGEADFSTLTTLAPGDIEGQDATCAAVRADVSQFLLVHTVADMEMAMMEAQ